MYLFYTRPTDGDCCIGSCIEHPDDIQAVMADRSSLLFYDRCNPLSCALSNGLHCALCVALYAVRGLYEQANEHLAYKAKLSGINLS